MRPNGPGPSPVMVARVGAWLNKTTPRSCAAPAISARSCSTAGGASPRVPMRGLKVDGPESKPMKRQPPSTKQSSSEA